MTPNDLRSLHEDSRGSGDWGQEPMDLTRRPTKGCRPAQVGRGTRHSIEPGVDRGGCMMFLVFELGMMRHEPRVMRKVASVPVECRVAHEVITFRVLELAFDRDDMVLVDLRCGMPCFLRPYQPLLRHSSGSHRCCLAFLVMPSFPEREL